MEKPSQVVAIASLYLAGKVEEEPRSLKDVIRKAKGVQAKKRAANVEKSRSDVRLCWRGRDNVAQVHRTVSVLVLSLLNVTAAVCG